MAHGNFEFRGTGLSCLWLMIWTWVLIVITFGIFFPWAYSAQQRWIATRTFIDGKPLCFKGAGVGFIWHWLLIMVLTFITLGLYTPWAYCRLKRWETDNLYFADVVDIEGG